MDIIDILMWVAGGIGTLGVLAVGLVVMLVSGLDRGQEQFAERPTPSLRTGE